MNKTLLAGVAALGLATLTGAATAQSRTERPANAQRADINRQEPVSRADFVDRRVSRLTAADANGDGSVTREERQAHRQSRMQQRAEARFARLDANNDGALSLAEFTARDGAARPARAHRGPGRSGPRMAAHGSRGAERAPVQIAEARAKAEQAFARLDTDNDGFISAAERRAGRQQAREHRRERMAERRAARDAARDAARQASPPAPASE